MKKEVAKKKWKSLTPRQKELREKSLRVVSYMKRNNVSLTQASKKHHTTPQTVVKYSNALKKPTHQWIPKRWHKLERIMAINEQGKSNYIAISDSRHASTIGEYHNAVKQFLETGDLSVLTPFEGKQVRDADGHLHTLETNPDNLYDIYDRRENEEFYSIYHGG